LRRILASPGKWLVFTVVYWLLVNLLSYSLWHSFGPKDLLISFPASDTPTILLEEFIKYCPLIRLPEFMAGILTYVCWSRYRKHLKPVLMLVISFISLVMLVAFSDRLPATLIHNGLSMVVWLPLVLYGAGASSPILTSSFSVFLGRLSFGLYLFHAPCLLYVKAAAKRMPGLLTPDTVLWTALLLSFLLATVCHLCIEETMRRRIYKTISPNLPADR
jgi:peptidoglycan/LPS O-acetylase OafA/YrhL